MQKKSNSFLKKEIEKFKDARYIKGFTFDQIKKISVDKEYWYVN